MKELSPYLRLIQKTGFTRHPGGLKATDLLLDRTQLTKDSHVLDIGCGAGHTMAHVAKKYGCFITGVDIAHEPLERARNLYGEEDFFKKLTFLEGDIEDLKLADNSFDVILCESVLIFVKDKEKALNEMARVLKPGGFLAINELCLAENGTNAFFNHPLLGGFLPKAEEILTILTGFKEVLYDEKPFSISEQLIADLKQYTSLTGIFNLLEGFHQILVDQQTRKDLMSLGLLFLSEPKQVFTDLNWLLLLMRKK